jgi:hypothetical protein
MVRSARRRSSSSLTGGGSRSSSCCTCEAATAAARPQGFLPARAAQPASPGGDPTSKCADDGYAYPAPSAARAPASPGGGLPIAVITSGSVKRCRWRCSGTTGRVCPRDQLPRTCGPAQVCRCSQAVRVVRIRLKRIRYRPGLIEGFFSKTGVPSSSAPWSVGSGPARAVQGPVSRGRETDFPAKGLRELGVAGKPAFAGDLGHRFRRAAQLVAGALDPKPGQVTVRGLSGLPAAGRAHAACSCRTSSRLACGARQAMLQVSQQRHRSSECGVSAGPARRATPGQPARTAPGRRDGAAPRSRAGGPAAQHPSHGPRERPGQRN